MPASRRRFRQEFTDQLCEEVISTSKTVKSVADSYGVGAKTLRYWLKKYRQEHDTARHRGSADGLACPGYRSWSGRTRGCWRRLRS
jgi:transposase